MEGERILRGFMNAVGYGSTIPGWDPWLRVYSAAWTVALLAHTTEGIKTFIDTIIQYLEVLKFHEKVSVIHSLSFYVIIFLLALVDLFVQRRLSSLIEEVRAVQDVALSIGFSANALKAVNSKLEVLGYQPDGSEGRILPLMELHCRICSFIDGIADAFKEIFILQVLFITLFLTFNVYIFAAKGFLYGLKQLGFRTSICICLLYFITLCGQRLKDQVSRTGEISRRIASRSTLDDASVRQLQLFLSGLACSPTRISASGFFAIDKQLFLSILAAVMTYLLVLVQFQTAGGTNQV
ncbi:unnamed protein product [Darwinula stevensoni]|uniref:Gustatory receptor n=1 Tax=Darwinula stevensoni TaxID=69355 RepID=A0A7R9AFR7_9CRUS|nr:unnamed protein product [Darwinula stevensoni]CAG0903241.1 unnamed protein product [Darwinula stevensoni]